MNNSLIVAYRYFPQLPHCYNAVLKHRKFDHTEIVKLCGALESNSTLTELYASNHVVSVESAAALGAMLSKNSTLTSLCLGAAPSLKPYLDSSVHVP